MKPPAIPGRWLVLQAWVRKNVFPTPEDSLVSLMVLGGAGWLAVQGLEWLVFKARWGVVWTNRHLLLMGSYPEGESWRVWMGLLLLAGLAGWNVGVARSAPKGLPGDIPLSEGPSPSDSNPSVLWVLLSRPALFWLGAGVWGGVLAFAGEPWLAGLPVLWGAGRWLGSRLAPDWGWKARGLLWGGWLLIWLVLLNGLDGAAWLPPVESPRWGGLLLTGLITLAAIGCSIPLGILLALGRRGSWPVVRWLSTAYIETVRGVPLITVLFLGQLLMPLFLPAGWALGNLTRVMVAVAGFSAAYMAENIRGGLQGVGRGQVEAAQALGLSQGQTLLLVVLPQALRNAMPTLAGQCITLFKDTSLVAVIGMLDFLSAAQAALSQAEFAGHEGELYVFVAFVYWVFSYSLSRYSRGWEARPGI